MDMNKMLTTIRKPTLRYTLYHNIERSSVIQSVFGGKPYIEEESDVECCKGCKERFSYVMQVVIPDKQTLKERLYALYYCFECASKGDTGNFQIVVYNNPKEEKAIEYTLEDEMLLFEEKVIIFYNAYEFPEYEYLEQLYPEQHNALVDEYGKKAFQVYEDLKYRYNHFTENTGYKVFGYPEEIMPLEVPKCGLTGELMELFMIIPSADELGLKWGNSDEDTMIIFKSHNANSFKSFVSEWDLDDEFESN